ncbi:MAG TPA: ATP-binding protein [Rhodocyclaceae bacterium]
MLRYLRTRLPWPAWPVALSVAAADVLVVGVIAVSLQASYRMYFERAAITARNTSRLVAQNIVSEIERVDMGLGVVQDEYERERAAGRIDPGRLATLLRRQQARLPMVDEVRIADARGRLVYSSRDAVPAGISIGDRPYFVALRDDRGGGLAISRPLANRVTGKPVVILARRLSGPDGQFDGVVSAPVAIEWFNQKFAALKVGAGGTVVLRGNASRDFDLLARFPQAGLIGQTTISPVFRAMVASSPQGGVYRANAAADDVERTFSYEAVGAYPLIALVGLSTEDTLTEWRPEAAKFGLLAAVFAVLSALGARFLLRSWGSQLRAYEEVRILNARLERDIFARAQAEAEVTRLNTELEARVQERTRELQAANRELESFSYSVSHDLRAPLRAIDGYSAILMEDNEARLDDEGRRCLERIRGNATRMGNLIDDMLDFSRTARREMQVASIDMHALAREVFDEVRGDAPRDREIELRLGRLPPARGDRAMIRQVLVNLISNAIKFSAPRDRAVIEIAGTAGGGESVYSVRDNGVGFDMQYADKLFGVFQRLHGAAEFPGTGIGLAIVKRIVERHGGRVWAESRPGEGAAMHFTLPSGGS